LAYPTSAAAVRQLLSAITAQLTPSQMTVASFNFKNPRSTRASSDSQSKQDAVPSLEIDENTGSYDFKNIDDGELPDQCRIEERDAQGRLFEAHGNDRTAQPGRWFTLRGGHFDAAVEGKAACE
jgi:type VI secretion system secreted protein VgrG